MFELAKLIKDKRKLMGISQGDLAKMLKVSDQYISNFERNKSYIAYWYLPTISKKLLISRQTLEEAIAEDEKKKVRQHFVNIELPSNYIMS